MPVLLGAIKKSDPIQKRVDEINERIKRAGNNSVEDPQSTWGTRFKYQPLKYSRGVLFITFFELDLYKYNRTGKEEWKKVTERVGKFDIPETLTIIKRYYREYK
jgi:hypothetical protein